MFSIGWLRGSRNQGQCWGMYIHRLVANAVQRASRLAANDDGTSTANGTEVLASDNFLTGIEGHRQITSHPHPHPHPNPTRYNLLTYNSNERCSKTQPGSLVVTAAEMARWKIDQVMIGLTCGH